MARNSPSEVYGDFFLKIQICAGVKTDQGALKNLQLCAFTTTTKTLLEMFANFGMKGNSRLFTGIF